MGVTNSAAPVESVPHANGPSTTTATARDLAATDLDEARHLHGTGDLETARLFCRNALALNLLTEAQPERDERATRIMAMIEACEVTDLWVTETCPACEGRMANCRRCGGSGRLRRRRTIDERKYLRGQAVQRYRILQQGRSRVALGEAWVPPELLTSLTTREQVTLRRATATGCRTCMGFGRTDCSTCGGTGAVACRRAGCEDGIVTVQREGLSGNPGVASRSACPVCQGRGVAECERCRAAGSVLCRTCNGSGVPDGCRRCGGDGLTACRSCRGTGESRGGERCATCKGDGVDMCQSCSGTGCRQ